MQKPPRGAFRRSHRDVLLANKRALDDMADLAGKPRMDYGNLIPAAPVKRAKRGGKTPESSVNDAIAEWARGRLGLSLYRNNRGQVVLPSGARITYGVGPNGASDWIGYRVIVVTPAMVGCELAQFVALEAKPDGKNATPEQDAFIDRVLADGGCAGVAHSAAEAAALVRGW